MSIVRNFNLYLNAGNGSAPYINANQYDQGEQWVFTLYKEEGTKYTPSTGAIVGIKADNRGIINTGTVDSEGRVVINETQQMTAAAGIAIFELLIDGDSHGTANFLVNVEQRPGDNADLSDSDLSLIQQAVDSAAEIEDLLGGQDVPTVITPIISDWLDENITNPSNPPIDTSLTIAGAAADAKVTGDEITDVKSKISVLYRQVTNVLSIELTNGSYIDADGQSRTNTNSSRTDFIPVTGGSTITLNGVKLDNLRSVVAYSAPLSNADKREKLNDGTTVTGEFTAALPVWAKYIRATGAKDGTMTGSETYSIKVTGTADVLDGKKWFASGDSFTAGSFSSSLTDDYTFTDQPYYGENKVYPFWIGRRNQGLTVINEAISGSTMGAGENGVNPFSGNRYQTIPADADYVTLMFGINDSGHGVPIGTIDDDDNTTFYGAWNVVLAWIIENRPFAHIGIIIGPGMQTNVGKTYADAEIAVAKKWGIPYLNFQYESGGKNIPLMLRTSNPDVSAVAKGFRNNQQYVNPSEETPNYHPNEDAHEFMSTVIEAWLKTL